MKKMIWNWVLAVLVLTGAATAQDGPKVVVDIAPLHSLVAQVMGDMGQPDLLVPPTAFPHDFSLRPSQARDLETADIVFWVGPELTPWLGDALPNLSPKAKRVEMLKTPGTFQRMLRDGGQFGGGGEHADESDPHAWLDPENAALWLERIAQELAATDPENSGAYKANAEDAIQGIKELSAEVSARLAPVRDIPFIVYHDAFQHFEARFGLTAIGSVASGEGAAPGARRMAEMRALAEDRSLRCLFTEPQVNRESVAQVFDGSGVSVSVLDPLGVDLDPGPGLYEALIESIGQSIAACQSAG